MNTALLSALREIEVDKGIPFDTVQSVLEESLLAAYLNREEADEEARVVLDRETGDLRVMKDGEDITPADFTRIAAQVMRQAF
jgi:N utilization substance protein A